MVLNMEHVVPTTTISPLTLSTLSGFVDYTAIAADKHIASKFTLAFLNHQAHYFL